MIEYGVVIMKLVLSDLLNTTIYSYNVRNKLPHVQGVSKDWWTVAVD